MAYVRLPLVCRDFILGTETVNQAIDNLSAARALFVVRHGLEGLHVSTRPGLYDADGHHDDALIPRLVGHHLHEDAIAGQGNRPEGVVWTGEDITSWLVGPPPKMVTSWRRVAAGIYLMRMRSAKPFVDWLECTAEDWFGGVGEEANFIIGHVRPDIIPSENDPNAAYGCLGLFYAYRWVDTTTGFQLRDTNFSVAYFST